MDHQWIYIVFFFVFLYLITSIFLILDIVRFNNCANKEHSACPVFNCETSDMAPYGPDGNYCGNQAFRIDANGRKYCSGDIFSK